MKTPKVNEKNIYINQRLTSRMKLFSTQFDSNVKDFKENKEFNDKFLVSYKKYASLNQRMNDVKTSNKLFSYLYDEYKTKSHELKENFLKSNLFKKNQLLLMTKDDMEDYYDRKDKPLLLKKVMKDKTLKKLNQFETELNKSIRKYCFSSNNTNDSIQQNDNETIEGQPEEIEQYDRRDKHKMILQMQKNKSEINLLKKIMKDSDIDDTMFNDLCSNINNSNSNINNNPNQFPSSSSRTSRKDLTIPLLPYNFRTPRYNFTATMRKTPKNHRTLSSSSIPQQNNNNNNNLSVTTNHSKDVKEISNLENIRSFNKASLKKLDSKRFELFRDRMITQSKSLLLAYDRKDEKRSNSMRCNRLLNRSKENNKTTKPKVSSLSLIKIDEELPEQKGLRMLYDKIKRTDIFNRNYENSKVTKSLISYFDSYPSSSSSSLRVIINSLYRIGDTTAQIGFPKTVSKIEEEVISHKTSQSMKKMQLLDLNILNSRDRILKCVMQSHV